VGIGEPSPTSIFCEIDRRKIEAKSKVCTTLHCLPLLFANNIRILYAVIYFTYDACLPLYYCSQISKSLYFKYISRLFTHINFSLLDRVEQWGYHRPLIKPYVRFSRIRLSDILLPSAFSRKYLLVLPAMSILRPFPHFQVCIYVVSSDCTTG